MFTNGNIFRVMEDIFLSSLDKFLVDAYVYLFMPDHLHMLLEGKEKDSDIRKCVIDFKQKSGYWFAKQQRNGSRNLQVAQDIGGTQAKACGYLTPGLINWQKDFYDHIMRKDEDIKKHVRYILENPLRKGIVVNWKEYPYKGSTLYNFNEW